jgi:hypothetical protein
MITKRISFFRQWKNHNGWTEVIRAFRSSAKVNDMALNKEIHLLPGAAEQISKEMEYVQHSHFFLAK